jgi:uncharacterized protein (TIGR01777 family)
MKILLTGGTGFVGAPLVDSLRSRGDSVMLLSRTSSSRADVRTWKPEAGELDSRNVAGFDAVIHLAGESIMGLWTAGKRRRIRDSRVQGTGLLVDRILSLPEADRPRHFLTASAIGYYGDHSDEVLTEDSTPASGWLTEACVAWEGQSKPLDSAGVRVVRLRLGIVLDPDGGALKQMLPSFRLGLGAKLGNGKQWFSWVSRRDAVAAIIYVLDQPELAGAINVTAPMPVTNAEFSGKLAQALHRPLLLAAPAPLLRLLPGEMAEQALLGSARVIPQILEKAGFRFQDPDLSSFFSSVKL